MKLPRQFGFRVRRVARRIVRALRDAADARSLFLTLLCLRGWASARLGRRCASREATLDLKRVRLCVDTSRGELNSYWEIWNERCYDAIAVEGPGCVVDVGANVGVFSLYQAMVQHAQRVIAFEPVPDVFSRLRKNLALNGVTNVRAVNAAVGEKAGMLVFDEGRLSINSRVNETGSLEVPCVTLDDELCDVPRLDLLKIDTEGYEVRVLRGAAETLQKTARIGVELHYGGEQQEIESILLPLGFCEVKRQDDLIFYISAAS